MPLPDPEDLLKSIATPEGDNEATPDTPLTPNDEAPQIPPGSAPTPSDAEQHKPEGIEKFIDEIVRGEYM